MDYDALLSQVMELLQREKRVPYRALKRRFDMDDDYIEDLKIDLIEAKRLAIDENDRILVWIGSAASAEISPSTPVPSTPEPFPLPTTETEREPVSYTPPHLAEKILTSRSALEGERKQVTVLLVLRGKIIAKLGDTDTAGTELQRAFTLADQLQSPSLIYPIAYDLGRWHESTGNEREAATLYGKAKAPIEQMATSIEDEALRTTFLQSALVQEIHERVTRLGG